MSNKQIIVAGLNRVEGDLEIRVEIEDGYVIDAWSSGTMFRGIEKILIGRGSLDGLVITPRVCGICSTSHLTAASLALNMIANVTPPPNAIRVSNLALMVEHIQSDMRHGFLMFMPDFTNPIYKGLTLFEEAVQRYTPFLGQTVSSVIQETKKLIEIIAILGGQWPHSSFIVPGGVVSNPSDSDLLQCQILLKHFWKWYENRILGCELERWLEVKTVDDIDSWLNESPKHYNSDLGFYIRFAREIGLNRIGKGHEAFISFGAFDIPEGSCVQPLHGGKQFIPAGFVKNLNDYPFDQEKVAEHVAYSWFMDYEGGRHPFIGETRPYATGRESEKYSWAKAPRYDGFPAETGPLAEMIISQHPLFIDLIKKHGASAFVRELARLVRPACFLPAMKKWLNETKGGEKFYIPPGSIVEGQGYGLTGATRGALGHWVKISEGAITQYQIITPTAWNLSPRDSNRVRGPAEEALIGTPVKDISDPVTLGHVVRSFDACQVCTVH